MSKHNVKPIKKIIILGGGTAGWMTAAALSNRFQGTGMEIMLIESDHIGTIGVGEATLPHLRFFNKTLGIDEFEFMRATQATYKLGIDFVNWGAEGESYVHPFGEFGQTIGGLDFHHLWVKGRQNGNYSPIGDYSLPVVMARKNKMMLPVSDMSSMLSSYSYAYHLDASLYAKFLRDYAEARRVVRKEAVVQQIMQDDDGSISAVCLDTCDIVEADFFIDCSGFRAKIISQCPDTDYINWQKYLPCNRAIAVPCEKVGPILNHTRAVAHEAGWQWRIPLQHRTGNGIVYSSDYLTDDKAEQLLMASIDGKPTANINKIQFKAGKRNKSFSKNCVAIGLSSGFLEPLESTSLYLVQIAIMNLIELFPTHKFDVDVEGEFNRRLDNEYEKIRDFLILHYHVTQRADSAFWNYCRNMELPDSLRQKIQLFDSCGYVASYTKGLFLEASWAAVCIGQGLIPKKYHPQLDRIPVEKMNAYLNHVSGSLLQATEGMLQTDDFFRGMSIDPRVSDLSAPAMSLYRGVC